MGEKSNGKASALMKHWFKIKHKKLNWSETFQIKLLSFANVCFFIIEKINKWENEKKNKIIFYWL